MIVSEGVATDGEIMRIGNTQTHVRFPMEIDAYFEKWFQCAPIHHCAMSIGHNAEYFRRPRSFWAANVASCDARPETDGRGYGDGYTGEDAGRRYGDWA